MDVSVWQSVPCPCPSSVPSECNQEREVHVSGPLQRALRQAQQAGPLDLVGVWAAAALRGRAAPPLAVEGAGLSLVSSRGFLQETTAGVLWRWGVPQASLVENANRLWVDAG